MRSYSVEIKTRFQAAITPVVFSWAFSMLFIAFLCGIFGKRYMVLIWLAVSLIAVIWIAQAIYIYFRNRIDYKKHNERLAKYAAEHKLEFSKRLDMDVPSAFTDCSILRVHDVREPSCLNLMLGPDWSYVDLQYKIYERTQYGQYYAATVYYSVMSVTLPRQLPNVLFDSVSAHKRQFHLELNNKQSLKIEGNFNQYFAVYCPEGYTIDTLSFITPDVMESLISASEYDVEIINNRLYLYSSLKDPYLQIDDMVTKIHAIEKELLDNVLTYRDERLHRDIGRSSVAIEGTRLKGGSIWILRVALPALLIIAFSLITMIIAMIYD